MRGKVVLDFGCGSGENSLVLARRGARVIGFDISESLLRLAERRMALNGMQGQATFLAASAHELPIASGSIDVVVGIAILHHLDLAIVSRETRRVLAPGGRAIFQEPVRNSRMLRALRALIPYRHSDVSPYERPLTDGELQAFGSAFRSCRARAFRLPHVQVATAVPALRKLVHPCCLVDGMLLRMMPRLSALAGVRVFELTS